MPDQIKCMVRFWVLVFCALGWPGLVAAGPSGMVRVVDGDTLRVGGVLVRLHGIDAPEMAQTCRTEQGVDWPCGAWVRDVTVERFEGRQAICTTRDTDRYGRVVATCSSDDSDIGGYLVRRGLAFAYRRYSTAYVAEETAAAAQNTGLWAMQVQDPAAFRRAARDRNASHSTPPPSGCAIKGNINRRGVRIYHLPGQPFYANTKVTRAKGERWFCSEPEARRAGWRKARG